MALAGLHQTFVLTGLALTLAACGEARSSASTQPQSTATAATTTVAAPERPTTGANEAQTETCCTLHNPLEDPELRRAGRLLVRNLLHPRRDRDEPARQAPAQVTGPIAAAAPPPTARAERSGEGDLPQEGAEETEAEAGMEIPIPPPPHS